MTAMLCPVCQQHQVIVEFEGVELDICLDGHGTWFDDQELHQLFESLEAPAELLALTKRFERVEDPSLGEKRRCPRCTTKMDHVRAPAEPEPVILDRCPHGHGLWFDDGELQQILTASGAEDSAALERIRQYLSAFEQGSSEESSVPEETQS